MRVPSFTRFLYMHGSHVPVLRNDLVEQFEGDWLLFVDSDMIVPEDGLEKLLSHNKPIVGGLCFRKVPPYNPTIYFDHGNENFEWQYKWPEDGLFECDATGTAFLLVRREVFDKIKKPIFEYTDISEDLLFCRKAREAGFKIWIDPTVEVGHIRPKAVYKKDFLDHNKDAIENHELNIMSRMINKGIRPIQQEFFNEVGFPLNIKK